MYLFFSTNRKCVALRPERTPLRVLVHSRVVDEVTHKPENRSGESTPEYPNHIKSFPRRTRSVWAPASAARRIFSAHANLQHTAVEDATCIGASAFEAQFKTPVGGASASYVAFQGRNVVRNAVQRRLRQPWPKDASIDMVGVD